MRKLKPAFFDRASFESAFLTPENIAVPASVQHIDQDRYYADRLQVTCMFDLDTDDGGYLFVEMTGEPGTFVPRHRHNWDQIVFVVEGSMSQGNRVLSAGSGYFTPAGQPYGFVVGPHGAHWIEFHNRCRAKGTTEVVEDDPARWVHADEVGRTTR